MYNIEKVNKAIKDIEEYFLKLGKIGLSKENLEIDEKFYSSSMLIFGILNRAIDLAEEILIKNDFGMPSSYVEYFEVLGKEGIIDKKNAEELKKIIPNRNIFAHEYFNVERKLVLKLSKDIYAVKEFTERVKKLIIKENKK
jgi:uncharacterized protein YutE (UPF0331/DUF86 family)